MATFLINNGEEIFPNGLWLKFEKNYIEIVSLLNTVSFDDAKKIRNGFKKLRGTKIRFLHILREVKQWKKKQPEIPSRVI